MANNIETIRARRLALEKENEKREAATEKPGSPVMLVQCSGPVEFYNVEDIMRMTSWSRHTVLKMFENDSFPGCNYGKNLIVEKHALIAYFSVRRSKGCRNGNN